MASVCAAAAGPAPRWRYTLGADPTQLMTHRAQRLSQYLMSAKRKLGTCFLERRSFERSCLMQQKIAIVA